MPMPTLISSFPIAPEVPLDADKALVSTLVSRSEEARTRIVASNPKGGPIWAPPNVGEMPMPTLISSFPIAPEVPLDADKALVSTLVSRSEEARTRIVASNPKGGPIWCGSSSVGVEGSNSS
ncbi:unnamed protein product [Ilex paraguariensis]|uniref:Uncharacterized protein n=1 Tax=Ilex paraguariensis TaxID=185542 RepID=A0ABC8T1A6_9AQUA